MAASQTDNAIEIAAHVQTRPLARGQGKNKVGAHQVQHRGLEQAR
jgi:hypothetical protein